jgi:hypothetical protein
MPIVNADRMTLLWMATNAVGIAAFLALASESWIEPELADVPGASGGQAFVWAMTALPVLVFFSIANLGWLLVALGRSLLSQSLKPAISPSLVMVLWVLAFIYDGAHHGI